MIVNAEVSLPCCEAGLNVGFRHAEAPVLPANQFRKTISCPSCTAIVIVTMTIDEGGGLSFDHEIVG